ncbi:hypothetical protein BDV10DRAFT_187128 [Aspergillus recurvatus]
MADPLSIAASIAGLIALTEELFRLVCKFSCEAKDAKKDIYSLSSGIRSLSVVLYDLSLLARSFEDDGLDTIFRLHHVNACRQTVQDAKTRLEKAASGLKGRRMLAITTRLKWPYTSKDVTKLVEEISRHKATMTLALSADSMRSMLQALSKQEELGCGIDQLQDAVKDIQTRIILDKYRQDVLDFFMRYNPQPNLEMSLQLRHPLTGLWLTEGDEFQTWLDSQNARLWLSGIPGAGKTILAGLMIEESIKRTLYGGKACCFFFCDYQEPKTQDPINILSSLASQLARQDDEAFEILAAYHATLHPEKGLPKTPDRASLLDILSEMSAVFDQVLVVIDGLDECGTESSVTEDLFSLIQNAPSLSIALLSRPAHHIRLVLQETFRHIEIAAQSGDVQLYVRAQLRERIQKRKLRIRRESLEGEIVQALISGAQGMFRWVSCQLDYLCELPTDADRKEALGKLPPTLSATYERILHDTPPASVPIMRMTLRIVAAAGPEITIPELCDAVSLRDGKSRIDDDEKLDEEEVTRICGSLIRKSSNREYFEFAHFTVREFLESTSLLHTPLEPYHITSNADWFLIQFCLRFLLLDNFSKPLFTQQEVFECIDQIELDHPFYDFATWTWPFMFRSSYARAKDSSDQSRTGGDYGSEPFMTEALLLVNEMFHADKSAHFLLWSANLALIFTTEYTPSYNHNADMITNLLHADFTPLHMASILTLEYVVLRLTTQDSEALAVTTSLRSPAQCLLLGMPALLSDAGGDTSEDSIVGPGEDLDSLLYKDWMGNNTSPEIWLDILKRLYTVVPMISQHVRFASSQYSILDLIFRRSPTEPALFTKQLPHFVSPAAKVDRQSIRFLRKAFEDCDYSSGNGGPPRTAAISNALDELFQTARTAAWDETTLSYLHDQLSRIRVICHLSSDVTALVKATDLKDRDYDSAVAVSVQYDNVPRLQELSSDPRLQTYHERNKWGKSAVHIAANRDSFRALEYFLDLGLDSESRDKDGMTPIHVAGHQCLRILLGHGASDAARDNAGNTVWHLRAKDYDGGLNALLGPGGCLPTPAQLDAVNHEGYTPMALALSNGHRDNARLLLPHCRTAASFGGPLNPYKLALETGIEDVIEALAAANIPTEGDISPIHHVKPWTSSSCVRLLKTLRPDACSQRYDGRLPVENLLLDLGRSLFLIQHDPFAELIPEAESQKAECFEFFCSHVIPRFGSYAVEEDDSSSSADDEDDDPLAASLETVFEVYFDYGVLVAYERHLKRAALQPLVDALVDCVGNMSFPWQSISSLDSMILRIMKLSELNIHNVDSRINLSQLLCVSAFANWEGVVRQILSSEMGDDELAMKQSALEFVCQPKSQCSPVTFGLLLSDANTGGVSKMNDISGARLIQLLARNNVAAKVELLRVLLEHGVDPNIRYGSDLRPAVVDHVLQCSLETAKLLLEHGADPELTCADGFNVLLATVWQHDSTTLRRLRRNHPNTQWKRTLLLRPEFCPDSISTLAKHRELPHCSALHIAAAVGSFSCLRYLITKGLVDDINATTGPGYTCAHLATGIDAPKARKILKYLSSKSCNINALSDLHETPLDVAIRSGAPQDVIDCLLKLGAKPGSAANAIVPQDDSSNPSDDMRILELLEDDALLRLYDEQFITTQRLRLLGKAIKRADVAACVRLQAQGCPLDEPLPAHKCLPIMWALETKQPAMIRWLVNNGGGRWATRPDQLDEGVIQYALRFPELNDVLNTLMFHYESSWPEWITCQWSALMAAITWSNTDGLRLILEYLGKMQHRRQYKGLMRPPELPDIINMSRPLPLLHQAVQHDNKAVIEILLEYGADINILDEDTLSALHWAVQTNAYLSMMYLLEQGCSWNASVLPNSKWSPGTPLEYALRNNDLTSVQILLPYMTGFGCNYVGTLPWDCCLSRDALALLLDHGFGFPTATRNKQTIVVEALTRPLTCGYILQRNLITEIELDRHEIPAHYHFRLLESIPRMLRALGKRRMQIMFPTEPQDSDSPLCVASARGLLKTCEALLSMGAKVDFDGHRLGSALMVACANGQFEVAKFLVRAGARTKYSSTRDQEWKSALAYAEFSPPIRRWLLVDRYLDQHKLTSEPQFTPQMIRPWGGLAHAELPLTGERERHENMSSLGYAIHLGRLSRSYRGQVVYYPVRLWC